jgi:hypothetical protein
MKVFISWSGERSKAIADALHHWLPTVIQSIETWMSEHDIDKGTRNIPAISKNLEETQFGIICLTPENLNAPWLLFEAGALSKSQEDARVWTFLYALEYVDVQGPLSQFQHTKAQEDDVRKLLQAINKASVSSSITDQQLQVSFDRGWPELEESLRTIPATTEDPAPKRSDRDLIEESLTILRKLAAGEAEPHLAPTLNADTKLWSSIESLKLHFEWVESGSVPPTDLRPEVEGLTQKARLLRSKIKRTGGSIPLWLDVFWRELMQLRVKIHKYTEQEMKEYTDLDGAPAADKPS